MPPTLEEEDFQGEEDTIVVKPEEYPPSSRASSPSMTPEIDVQDLLAQINTPHLNTSETLEEGDSIQAPHSQSLPSRLTPRSRPKPNVSTMEDRLMAMPEVRPLPWRDGVEPGAENETGGESRRKQIRFGCLLATRGIVQESPVSTESFPLFKPLLNAGFPRHLTDPMLTQRAVQFLCEWQRQIPSLRGIGRLLQGCVRKLPA